ncbi:MAG: OmpA family protein [Bacteroidales bacterium]|jgi:outer membrane protein OmpA-like peptidoglycan-associated protein|nr:OmpA family protein [Bacteroidales bacterium]
MKNTASIILALSAAFCSLSAQEKQSSNDSKTVVLQEPGVLKKAKISAANDTTIIETLKDTASGLGATTQKMPQKLDLTLPLWEPQNKYLSLGFGGGLSTLKYDPKDCDRSPMAGGSINIDYNVFFSKKWGLSFGVGATVYNAKTIIDARYVSSGKIPVTLSDGTTTIEESEFYTDFKNWEERQTCIALESPIGLLYRRYLGGNTTLLTGAGLKLSYPVKTTYRVKAGNRKTSGYIENADLYINPDIPQHGYATKYERPRGTTDTKHISAGIYLDINFVHKTANANFFYGVYGNLGLSSITKNEGKSLTDTKEYCGLLASNSVDAANLNSIGVRLGVKIPCPRLRDDDNDGVLDKVDKCLGTPANVAVDSCGCPLDTDKDSVPDYLDQCPGTPKGVQVDSVGCPIDSDGDGIADIYDLCPNTPDSIEVDAHGCPVDSDGDGVADYLDKCPDTPNEALVDTCGCPVDTDGDEVPDYLDKCPTVKGSAKNNGCPEISAKNKAVLKKAVHGIQFETNNAVIKSSSYPILNRVVTMMKKNPSYKLHISGHTDNVGKPAQNLKLSKERAAAVVKYLTKKGIKSSRLRSDGFGGTKPVASNKTEKGKALNRRVDFEVEF